MPTDISAKNKENINVRNLFDVVFSIVFPLPMEKATIKKTIGGWYRRYVIEVCRFTLIRHRA